MDSFINRVMNGRVFKNLTDFAIGRWKLQWELEPRLEQTMPYTPGDSSSRHSAASLPEHCLDHTEMDQEEDRQLLDNRDQKVSPAQECKTREGCLNMEDENCQGNLDRPGSLQGIEGSRNNKPPTSAFPPEISTFQENDGQTVSAVTLSEQMFQQWNAVLRCEHEINQ